MKTPAKAKSQSRFLGVLNYKEEATYARDRKIPERWIACTREERMARILQDLPEAAFRSPAQLTTTLKAIIAEIYRQYPELQSPEASH